MERFPKPGQQLDGIYIHDGIRQQPIRIIEVG